MPEKRTLERANAAKRKGKAPSTQAGEFVREEMHHVREGKHGARSTKQAIAICRRPHARRHARKGEAFALPQQKRRHERALGEVKYQFRGSCSSSRRERIAITSVAHF